MEYDINGPTTNSVLRRPDCYLISLVIVLLLWPSLGIRFVSDNIGHITSAPNHFADLDFHFYRPFTILTLALDYAIWGLKPLGFHLTNLILHLLATFLVYLFAIRLTKQRTVALVASLLFGLHPIHSMSLFWISGRVDIVCTIFYLGSLIWLISFARTDRQFQLILSLFLYLCAIASKEMGLSMPLVVAAYLWVFAVGKHRHELKRSLYTLLPYVAITLFYFLFKYMFIGSQAFTSGAHLNANPVHLLKNVAMFGGFLVVPGYHIEIGAYLQSHQTLFVALAAGALAVSLVAFRWIARSKVTLFSSIFVILTLLPVIRLAMRWYLYLPSVGFCLLLGHLAWKLWERLDRKLPIVAGITMVAMIYAIFLVKEQSHWLTAGKIADEVSTRMAKTVLDEKISAAYVLTVPAEIDQTPILIFGLGSNVNAELKILDAEADTVDIKPVLLISLASESDYSKCRVKETDSGSFRVSLEDTKSYFVFPEDLVLVSGSRSLHVGDTIRADTYSIIVDNIKAGGEANSVTVQLSRNDIPLLLFKDGSYQIMPV